jgi:formiminotetrahydrofolate cyclodeaminase
MADFAERPLRQLLDDVASRSAAPGGGSTTAWACAFAAGLVEMTARYAGLRRVSRRAGALRAEALALAERDLYAYEPVLQALRLPVEHADRASALDAALSDAADPPLELARAAAEVAELALEVVRASTRNLVGDARAGLLLAEASCQAAARLVAIDLARRPQDPRLKELSSLRERAARARAAELRLDDRS